MTAQNFDRDLQFINLFEPAPLLSTSKPLLSAAPLPRTDGVVYDDVGTILRYDAAQVTLGAGEQNCAGVIMRRPEVRGVYRVTGTIYSSGNNAPALIGIAVAPAAPTAAATGEVVPHHQIVQIKRANDTTLIDLTLCIDNFGTISSTDYSARDIIFYVGIGDLSFAGLGSSFFYNLSVQRLSVGVPEYESKHR